MRKVETMEPQATKFRILSTDDWEKYRAFRLLALSTDPSAFSSTHSREVAMTDDQWKDRLRPPVLPADLPVKNNVNTVMGGAWTFIASSRHSSKTTDRTGKLLEKSIAVDPEWEGMVTLLGPSSSVSAFVPMWLPVPGDDRCDIEKYNYHLVSLYTAPTHRGKGIGWSLLRDATEFVFSLHHTEVDEAGALQGLVKIWVQVMEGNERAEQFYRKMGFRETKEARAESYEEGHKLLCLDLNQDKVRCLLSMSTSITPRSTQATCS